MANKKTKPKTKSRSTTKSTSPATSTKTTTVTRVVSGNNTKQLTLKEEIFSEASLSNAFIELVGAFALTALFLSITMSATGFGFVAANGQFALILFAIGSLAIYTALKGLFNPIFSVLAALLKKITPARAFVQIVAQVLGAMLAFILLNAATSQVTKAEITPEMIEQYGGQEAVQQMLDEQYPSTLKLRLPQKTETKEDGKTETIFNQDKAKSLLVIEFAGAMILAFLVSGYLADPKKNPAIRGAVYGLGTTAAILVTTQLATFITFDQLTSGGKTAFSILNPAMMAALSPDWNNWGWVIAIYAAAPLAGAIVGGFIYKITNRLARKA